MSLSIDSCRDAALELAALGDGALESASRRSLASHLLPCVDCQISDDTARLAGADPASVRSEPRVDLSDAGARR